MQTKRPVIASFRSWTINGEQHQVPMYVHRRLGKRDGWRVKVGGIERFFADEQSSTIDALMHARAFLVSVLNFDIDEIYAYLPIVVMVHPALNGSSEVTAHFVNHCGVEQSCHIANVRPPLGNTTVWEHALQRLPVSLCHLSYKPVIAVWLADFKVGLKHVFFPVGFTQFLNQTIAPLKLQMALEV